MIVSYNAKTVLIVHLDGWQCRAFVTVIVDRHGIFLLLIHWKNLLKIPGKGRATLNPSSSLFKVFYLVRQKISRNLLTFDA